MFKVLWSDFATENLRQVYIYYKEAAGITIAKKLKNKILNSTIQLHKHPLSGQIEFSLQHLDEGHRYIIADNYKVIYKVINDIVLITDVFDTRQDPVKISGLKHKEGH